MRRISRNLHRGGGSQSPCNPLFLRVPWRPWRLRGSNFFTPLGTSGRALPIIGPLPMEIQPEGNSHGMANFPLRRYAEKSARSTVQTRHRTHNSDIRTMQPSARSIGRSEYFVASSKIPGHSLARTKSGSITRSPRETRRNSPTGSGKKLPASASTASQVKNGLCLRNASSAHAWWGSLRANKATINPVSAISFTPRLP